MDYDTKKSNELYHHGIKGQKWGVRRFQNEDGTLTKAGKKHRSRGSLGPYYKRKKIESEIDDIRKQYIKENYSGKSPLNYIKVSREGVKYANSILSKKYGEQLIKQIHIDNKFFNVLAASVLALNAGVLISDLMI